MSEFYVNRANLLYLNMRTKSEKQKIVDELADKFNRQKIVIFTDFQGISVTESNILRKSLKKDDAEYSVAKKTLFDRALKEVGINLTTKELHGEIGVAFGYGDQVAPAKTLIKFIKSHETFKVLAGILAGRTLQTKEITALAKLPSREVLLAQVVGAMQAPIRGLAVALQANIRSLVVVLNGVKEKKA